MSALVNLDQIRAAHAADAAQKILDARGSDGDQLSGYHSLIITNGLLTTLAYSADKGRSMGEHMAIASALVKHLADLQKKSIFPGTPLPKNNLLRAIGDLSVLYSPLALSAMTDECMAYLNYLKRFVRAIKS